MEDVIGDLSANGWLPKDFLVNLLARKILLVESGFFFVSLRRKTNDEKQIKTE